LPPLNPTVADLAPNGPALMPYDERHAVTYARILDAKADHADWRDVCRIVLRIDPDTEPVRARRAYESHLARAQWASRLGYRYSQRQPFTIVTADLESDNVAGTPASNYDRQIMLRAALSMALD